MDNSKLSRKELLLKIEKIQARVAELEANAASQPSTHSQAEEHPGQNEIKYRTLFETMDEGFCILELARDKEGRVCDLRMLELNPAFERLTGVPVAAASGQLASRFFPGLSEAYIQTFTRVNETGQWERLENYSASNNRWYDVRIFPDGKDRLSVLYDDITERKQREANAALLIELDEEYSRLTSPEEILRTTGEKLGPYLDVAQCGFSEFDETNDRVNLIYSWSSQDMPNFTGTYRLSEFFEPARLAILKRGETVVVNNVLTDLRLSSQSGS